MPIHTPLRTAAGRLRAGLLALPLTLAGLLATEAAAAQEFQEVFTLDVPAYLGTWYEVARTPNDFEDNTPNWFGVGYSQCLDSTAEYALLTDGIIGIRNSCTREALDGSGFSYQDVVLGTGLAVPESAGRKYKIAFGPVLLRLLQRVFTGGGSDYWVYGVGPLDADGQYSWALVSGASRSNIFVLSRTETLDDATWDAILQLAGDEGLPVDDLVYRRTGFER